MLFKRKLKPIKIDKMALPDVIKRVAGKKKLSLEFRKQARRVLNNAGYKKQQTENILDGIYKLSPSGMKKVCNILTSYRLKGLGGYTSGSSMVDGYVKHLTLKQKRIQVFGKERRKEEVNQPKSRVSVLDNQSRKTSALENESATSSVFDSKPKKKLDKPAGSKKPPKLGF